MGRVRRFFRKVVTLGGTPRGIAGGFTLGVALSLIPVPVAGMLLALALAPALRMNVPAAYLGTALVNPLTGAAFYFAELWLGMTMLGRDPPSWEAMKTLDAAQWWAQFLDLLLPFAVGATVAIVTACAVCYPLVYYATREFQRRRADRTNDEAREATETPRASEPPQSR